LKAGNDSRSSRDRSRMLLTRTSDPGIVNVAIVAWASLGFVCSRHWAVSFICRAVGRSLGNMDLLSSGR
jgi:hypothetical protein